MPRTAIAEMRINPGVAAEMAAGADAALITIGRNSGESFDRKVEGDFNLTPAEKDLIRIVCNAFHSKGKKAVVVLNIGGVVETESWRALPDSILLAWQAGQESGNSIADIISGRVNPSGKLASTFPTRYEDIPSSKNFPGTVLEKGPDSSPAPQDGMAAFRNPKPSRIFYAEGIYVGYRYFESFAVKPAYEFGYGLSYTSFDYGKLSLDSTAPGEVTVTMAVKNAGKSAGKEVVQLYIAPPSGRLEKPEIELKAFAKTRLLSPGESQTLAFKLTPRRLASFDTSSSSWIAESGKYEVRVGASSRDIRQTASFMLDKDMAVKKESAALVPRMKINELTRAAAK
jgi:beta-glucosidase